MCLLKVVNLAFLQHLQLSFVCAGSSCFILSLVMVIRVNCIRISLIFQSVIWKNVFCFVVLIIPFLNSYCSKKSKNGGSLSYTRETHCVIIT